jgi:hypothetical protein
MYWLVARLLANSLYWQGDAKRNAKKRKETSEATRPTKRNRGKEKEPRARGTETTDPKAEISRPDRERATPLKKKQLLKTERLPES